MNATSKFKSTLSKIFMKKSKKGKSSTRSPINAPQLMEHSSNDTSLYVTESSPPNITPYATESPPINTSSYIMEQYYVEQPNVQQQSSKIININTDILLFRIALILDKI